MKKNLLGSLSVIGLLALLTGCPSTPISQTAPLPPMLTARPTANLLGAPAGTVMTGMIYPLDTATDTYEVDSPLRVVGAPNDSRNLYYAFTLHYQVANLRNITLSWSAGGANVPVVFVSNGPCDLAPDYLRMKNDAQAQTGTNDLPASFREDINAKLRSGTPVWWVTCRITGIGQVENGEMMSPDNTLVDYDASILLPTSLVGAQGGKLLAATRNVLDAQVSAFTRITIVPSPPMIGVIGDSISWGQGVPTPGKYFSLLATSVTLAPSSPVTHGTSVGAPRVIVKAHSAASLRASATTPATISGTTGCAFGLNPQATGAGNGEVPSRSFISCQAQDLAKMSCQVLLPSAANARTTPRYFCTSPAPAGAITVPVSFDAGPRFDYVFMDGCINDIGPIAILLGSGGLNNPATLTSAVTAACDMRLSVPDIKAVFPTAVIAHFGYHQIVSRSSVPTNGLGCLGVPPLPPIPSPACTPPPGLPPPPALPACPGFTIPASFTTAIDPLAAACFIGGEYCLPERATSFRATSNAILSTSIAAIDATPQRGRARYVFVPTTFNATTAAFAPASQTWGLGCTTATIPEVVVAVDPVATARRADCAAAINPGGITPPPRGESVCRLASAFHPDIAGHATIARDIRTSLASQGLFFRP